MYIKEVKVMSLMELLLDINNWSISDILSLISIIIAIIGGIFAFKQWVFSNKTKRAEFIDQIINKLRFQNEMIDAWYLIEYGDKWYNEDFHNNKELERKMDEFLSFLSYICYLYEEKHITNKEFSILQYEINRTCRSAEIQNYLWNLYHFSDLQKYECSYQYLIDYGVKNQLINKNTFYDQKSDKYKDVLDIKKRATNYEKYRIINRRK